MKPRALSTRVTTALLAFCLAGAIHAETLTPDLRGAPNGKGWIGDVKVVKLIERNGKPALEFNQSGHHVVWIKRLDFKEGTIEFDAKGKSGPPQSSFVGVAFRVVNQKMYDVVYFRPFNFRAAKPEARAHAVQYVSKPKWTWRRLRKEREGRYEKPIRPAPDGDAWFHAKIVIEKRQVSVFVNGETEPSLVVDELSTRPAGSVGLWCNGYGAIANLRITTAE